MTIDLTNDQKCAAKAAIDALFVPENLVSFYTAYRAANEAMGFPVYDQRAPGYRLADRHLQALSKKGLIEKKRYGGVWHWFATPAWGARE